MPGSLPLNIPESFSTFLRERSLTRARMRYRMDEAGRVRGPMASPVRLAIIGRGATGEENARCLASLDDAQGAGLRSTLLLLRALDPIAANTSPTVRL